MTRRLDPDEDALWQRVTATVRPIARRSPKVSSADKSAVDGAAPATAVLKAQKGRIPPLRVPAATPVTQQKPLADSLDGGWDRRLRRGVTQPEWTIDLHGHTLASAQGLLDRILDQAVAEGVRVLLLITGKPPRDDDRGLDGRPRRGLIRASIGSWLQSSRHASRIAAVRNAHPRHGGAGALYLILRRERE
ncbi:MULTISPECIES: Smr/MutS family protein [unclassified Sphingomonas]|uniref:Smr/MutS family protein n=1 Tax=unclassified Sphingomonas TaxID=196159 RepID=UPI0006F40A18|nr:MULTISPECIES: Smr/MutS family protein [unclassified Sphingomonas]KQX17730.1 DNA mismatch repair protein MutS [Sphingomonas sp. Root1294]KQY70656.1 DNA mismatch repair protein MutS [Sphingomonas sp. Root50]KRB91852.1 DNA mismatch repair protein MutS [Sphingomonas sp. Root720]